MIMLSMRVGRVLMGRLPHGSDLLHELTEICRLQQVYHAQISGVGALSQSRLGFYDQLAQEYEYIPSQKHCEILSLIGNVSLRDGASMVHAHLTLADHLGHAYGGHLAEGCKVFACEYIIQEFITETPLQRELDPETGLTLWAQP